MLPAPSTPRSFGVDLANRRQIALARIQELIDGCQERTRKAWRNYYTFQALTVGLAAITPCLIVLAKDNPKAELLNWMQLFFPALAAISAGVGHIFRWREDAVRYTALAESIRSQLWRFQTRSGEYSGELSDDQALDHLVVHVDELNLQSVARWSSAQLAEVPTSADKAKAVAAT